MNLVACRFERTLSDTLYRRIVFYQQDVRRDNFAQRGRRLLHRRLDSSNIAREIEREFRPLAYHALDRNAATGLLGDAIDRRQAQTSTVANRLGGEEWLEDVRHRFVIDAEAGVGDGNHDVWPGVHLRVLA